SNYHYLAPCGKPVHQRQELRHHSALDFAADLLPLWGDGIQLVNEYYRRRVLLRFLKDVAQPLLAFAVELAHYLRPSYRVKVGLRLVGHRLCKQGLACSGRAV